MEETINGSVIIDAEFISEQERAYREWKDRKNISSDIKGGVLPSATICRLMWCRENFPNCAIELDREGSPVPVIAKSKDRSLLNRIFSIFLGM